MRLLILLLLAAASGPAEIRKLTILHTNDLHARFLPDEADRGGFARLATAIQREKAGCHWCIVLDGGDLVQGSPASTIYRGVPSYEVANLLGIDVSTLGNHEFDYGWKQVYLFRRIARFPLLSANVVNDRGVWIADAPYVIRKVNGIRVGIIGAMLGNFAQMGTPAIHGPWRALPVVETVRRFAAQIKPSADLIVVLGHISEGPAILKEVPEVGIVVSGHAHNGLSVPVDVDGRMEVRVKGYGEELGRLDAEVDLPSGRLASTAWKRIPIDKNLPPEPRVAKLVAGWESKVAKVVDVPIGESRRALDQNQVRALIERAMREEMHTDFAYMNRGGVRDVIPQGRLLARHIWNVMPFDNVTVAGRFRGRDLPKAVLQGQTVDPDREYTFVTPDFAAANQTTTFGATGLEFPQKGPLLRDLIIDWIRKKKVVE